MCGLVGWRCQPYPDGMIRQVRVRRWFILAVLLLLAGFGAHTGARLVLDGLMADRLLGLDMQLAERGWGVERRGTAAAGEWDLTMPASAGGVLPGVSIRFQRHLGPWLGSGIGLGLMRVDFEAVVVDPLGPGSPALALAGTAVVNALARLTLDVRIADYRADVRLPQFSGTLALAGTRALVRVAGAGGEVRGSVEAAEVIWEGRPGPLSPLTWRLSKPTAELVLAPGAEATLDGSTLSLGVERIQLEDTAASPAGGRQVDLGFLRLAGRLLGPLPSSLAPQPQPVPVAGQARKPVPGGPPWPVADQRVRSLLALLRTWQQQGVGLQVGRGVLGFDPSRALELELRLEPEPGRGQARITTSLAWLRSAVDAGLRSEGLIRGTDAGASDIVLAARSLATYQGVLLAERRLPFGLRNGDAIVALLDWTHPALQLNGQPFLHLDPALSPPDPTRLGKSSPQTRTVPQTDAPHR